jgi:hypothetical protein
MTIIRVSAPKEDENKRNSEDVDQFYNKMSDACEKNTKK